MREQRQDHAQLRRAGDGQRQQQGGDDPLARGLQRAGDHGGHGVAAEAQHHRDDRPAVQPDRLEHAVDQHRQAGQVAAVLQDGEDQEEGADDGQDDGRRRSGCPG